MQTLNDLMVKYFGSVVPSNIIIIDDNVDGNQYIGSAKQGSETSAEAWTITKNNKGSPQIFTHSAPNQIWNDRTSGTYT